MSARISDENYYLYATEIGRICNAEPAKVFEILKLSEKIETVYHGIKRGDAISPILNNGIEPITPEGGNVSFWTTGLKLFINSYKLPVTWDQEMDTSFFHYMHARQKPNTYAMQLAVSDSKALEEAGAGTKWANNDQITLGSTVKPQYFSLLIVTLRHFDFGTPRERGALAERMMMDLLLEHLRDYSVGKVLRREFWIGPEGLMPTMRYQ